MNPPAARPSHLSLAPAAPVRPDWIALAQGVADALAPDAAERDRLGASPKRELALLREAGLLELLFSPEHGGGGGSFTDALLAVRVIGRADASIAQLLAYHYLHLTNALWRASPEQAAALARASVAGRWFWGGASNPRDPESRLAPVEDGYRLTGRKTFASNAALADRITLRAQLGDGFAVLVVPGDREGVTHGNDWDAFGQRLSESGTITFADVKVGRDEILGDPAAPPPPRTSLVVPFHQLLIVNFYIGIAEGALAEANRYIREVSRPWQASGVEKASLDPYILEHYGNLDVELRASTALADVAGLRFEAATALGNAITPDERNVAAAAIYAAKVHSSRTALEVTSRIFELMGARATAGHYGYDRFWRNIRTHTLHDPVVYKSREVGNYALNGVITPTPLYS
ncbi:alkylation response protein AidB-like acyl-CoA dehydrogenase [Xanthobacter flavus]|uniref:Dibenzothiophene monooxygenase n=1 Tax=Xanthobacter flavus TaxID=281 RepID=A0A9W6CS37_XANFL|nr:acyl-CoA dehydrogenase family protein [Xanthobacter flavus]MDR6334135.1 alkylation response protein AidB-like acyl-CoA dehydrogenase [Xanthobacter flavus]GLI22853.1 monooxygenase [Xanthobacter flavus]